MQVKFSWSLMISFIESLQLTSYLLSHKGKPIIITIIFLSIAHTWHASGSFVQLSPLKCLIKMWRYWLVFTIWEWSFVKKFWGIFVAYKCLRILQHIVAKWINKISRSSSSISSHRSRFELLSPSPSFLVDFNCVFLFFFPLPI